MKGEENFIDQKAIDLVTRIIRMVEHMPKDSTAEVMGKAVIRSSATAGIHYSDAGKSRSGREFIRHLHLMQIQLNQTDFWLKMIENTNYFKNEKIAALKESNEELMRIINKSVKTATEGQKKLAMQRRLEREKAKEALSRDDVTA